MKKIILLLLTFTSLLFVNNASASFSTGTLLNGSFNTSYSSYTKTLCNNVSNKCYYLKQTGGSTYGIYSHNGVLIFQTTGFFFTINIGDKILFLNSSGAKKQFFVFDTTNNSVKSQPLTGLPDGNVIGNHNISVVNNNYVITMPLQWNSSYFLISYIYNPTTSDISFFKGNSITCNQYLLDGTGLSSCPDDFSFGKYTYIIGDKAYFFNNNSFYSSTLGNPSNLSNRVELISGLTYNVLNYNFLKSLNGLYYLSFSFLNPSNNAFLNAYSYNGTSFTSLGNKYIYFNKQNTNTLVSFGNNDYLNFVYTGSSSPVAIPFWDSLNSSYSFTYIAKNNGLYSTQNVTIGEDGGGGTTGGGSGITLSGTITSTGSISMKKENQTCSPVNFTVDIPTQSEQYFDTSHYEACLINPSKDCTSDLFSDVRGTNSIEFQSNRSSVDTYQLFHSGSSFTGVSINSGNPFIGVGYPNGDIQRLQLQTVSSPFPQSKITVKLHDMDGQISTYEVIPKSNTPYYFQFSDKRPISTYEFNVTTTSSTTALVLKKISHYNYTTGSNPTNKTRYECTSQYLSCEWIDYETPEKQPYCYQNGDYNYIKDDYLVTEYEDNTQKNISLDTSSITDSINNIGKNLKDGANSIENNTGSLNDILNENNIGSGALNSMLNSELYQSFSGIINTTKSLFSTAYNTGVTFSGSACGKGNSGYPIIFSLPTGNNLSFQNHTVYIPNKKYTPCHIANIGGGTINTEYNNIYKYLLLLIFLIIYYLVIFFLFKYIIFGFFLFIISLLKNYSSILTFGFFKSDTNGNSDIITQIVTGLIIGGFIISFVLFFNYFTNGILTSLMNLLVIMKDIFGNLLNFFYTTLINQDINTFYTTIVYINSVLIIMVVVVFNYFIAKNFGGFAGLVAIISSLLIWFSDFFTNLFKDLFSFF